MYELTTAGLLMGSIPAVMPTSARPRGDLSRDNPKLAKALAMLEGDRYMARKRVEQELRVDEHTLRHWMDQGWIKFHKRPKRKGGPSGRVHPGIAKAQALLAEDATLTVQQIARRLDVANSTVYQWQKAGLIAPARVRTKRKNDLYWLKSPVQHPIYDPMMVASDKR